MASKAAKELTQHLSHPSGPRPRFTPVPPLPFGQSLSIQFGEGRWWGLGNLQLVLARRASWLDIVWSHFAFYILLMPVHFLVNWLVWLLVGSLSFGFLVPVRVL